MLILDEPTSGMDFGARKEMWDMLKSLKESTTILISTHYMEEADILGDRIAIMDHGNVVCFGSPMFLKNKFGKCKLRLFGIQNLLLFKLF